MPHADYFRKRRARLMEKDPYCTWCRRPLKLYPDYPQKWRHRTMPEDYPTIDHLESKFFGPRKDVKMKQRTLVLACPKCNNERSKKEAQKHIWRTRWKSGTFPPPFRWFGRVLKFVRKQRRTPPYRLPHKTI